MLARIIGLRRYPVKSMRGEELNSVEVTSRGLLGDRAVALVDARTRRLVSGKRPRFWARMLELTASLQGGLKVTFPDGRVVSHDLEPALADFLGREVYVLEEEDFEEGAFFDVAPLHLVTTRSLQSLSALAPGSRFELERFRPNVVLETSSEAPFPEDEWVGRELRLGPSVVVRVECATPRCVMATLPQGDLPLDKKVLKTMARHHRQPFLEVDCPALGMYAQVISGGQLRVGDEVSAADS
jgi:uncharacterized protein YcbX